MTQDFQHDTQHESSDRAEFLSPSRPAGTDSPADSPTSASDAGLDDSLLEETEIGGLLDDGEDDLLIEDVTADDEADLDEGLPATPQEIPITDLMRNLPGDVMEAPELSDLNAPGEIDIEELDENALSDTDIPRDALLDPLEE